MTLRTITVGQLIEALQDQDPEAQVVFSTDYGDHSHTEQALPLRGRCESVTITKSAYSNSGFAIAEPDEDDDEPTDTFVRIS
ncbi:MAG: hypothetical protein NUV51_09405 [Sulfuricaulis sp.]|nr:hypothetical protein [Sulfuricaulis sp.]